MDQPSSSFYRVLRIGLIISALLLVTGIGLSLTGRTQASPLYVAQPLVTLGVPAQGILGEPFSFTATFDNNYVAPPPETGYGPFIDLVFPVNGEDGDAGLNPPPDGLDFVSASYLGTPIDASLITELTFPGPAGSITCVDHPLATEPPNTPLQVCGPSGDKLVVIQLPFGSFTPDQPPATVTVNTSMSNLADLGMGMSIYARGGFQYGLDPLNNPCCDTSLVEFSNPDSSTWTSGAITPTLVTLEKSNDGPEGETATGPNYPRRYTLTIDIADGQTITDFDIYDYIDDNIVLTGAPTISPAGTLASRGGLTPPPAFTYPYGPAVDDGTANQLRFNIPTVTGTTAANDVVITFDFYVTDLNAGGGPVIPPDSGDFRSTGNRASAIGDWTPIDTPRDGGGTDNVRINDTCPGCVAIDSLQDQSIAIQKGVAAVGGVPVRSGTTLQYTLNFQISDYFTFDDIFITDIISDGQRFDPTFPPTITVSDQFASTAGGGFIITNTINPALDCAAAAGNLIVDTSEIGNNPDPATDGSTRLVFCVSKAMIANGQLDGILQGGRTQGVAGPATGTIVYRTLVQDNFSDTYPSGDPSVDHGDILTNSATIDGQIVDNTTLLPTGYGREPDDTGAGVTIAQGTLQKSIYAVNGSTAFIPPVEVRPGDTVTYRLRYRMPSTDFEDFVVNDYLPLPVFNATEITTFDVSLPLNTTIPPAGTAKYLATGDIATYDRIVAVLGGNPPIPALTTNALSNSVTFTFGDFDDPANTDSFVDIIFTVTVLPDPFADGLFLTNQAHATEASTNAGSQQQDTLVQIVLREPVLLVKKGVLDTDSPVETLTPATVSPVPVANVNTATSPPFTGVINSTNLAADPIDSDVSGVDSGDFVRFAIVIENVGGSSAFDIILTDVVPPGFILPGDPNDLHLQAWQGDNITPISYNPLGPNGDARDLFASGIELIDPAADICQAYHPGNGTNLVVITYDLQVGVTALAGGTVQNLATVTQYAGVDGEGPTNNHVDDVALFQDDAAVTVIAPTMTKARTATGINIPTNNDDQVVIGETITYQLDITVPEGTTLAAQVIDTLDAGLAIVDPTSVTATIPAGVTISGSTIPTVGGGGSLLTFNLGDVINTNTDSTDPNPANRVDEVITITYDVVALNVAGNQSGTTLNNSAVFSWNDGTTTRTQPAVSATDVTVIEPVLEVLKAAAPNTGDAGDTIIFTVTVRHTGASQTDAFDVTLSDVVTAGMTYVGGTWINTGGTAPISIDDSDPTPGGLTAGWATLAFGDSATMQFQVTLDADVTPSQTIDNIVDIAWTSLSGNPGQISTETPDSTERDGSGGINDYNATVTETVTVDSIATVKSLVSTSEGHTSDLTAPPQVAIGEIVRYRVEVTIPESLAAPMLITDELLDGLQFLDDGTAMIAFVSNDPPTGGITSTALSGAGLDVSGNEATVAGITPTFVIPGAQISPATFSSGTDPVFDLGTVTNLDRDGDNEFIVIEFNALVLNNPGSNDDGETRNNTAFVTIGGTPRPNSNIQQVQIVEPTLTLAKTPDGATGDADDTVTFTVVITNTSSTDAFDVVWNDIVPTGMTYVILPTPLTHTAGVAPTSTDDSDPDDTGTPDGFGLTATWATLPAGQSSTLTFNVTLDYALGPAQTVTNTADVTWTSLPGDQGTTINPTGSSTPGNSGDDDGERNGTSAGAHNDHSATDTGDVTINSPIPVKEILTTSEAHTSDSEDGSVGNERPLVVGEIMRYRLTSTIPEGTSTNFQIVDTLSAGLALVQDAQVTVRFLSDLGINPVTYGGLTAANGGPFALYGGPGPLDDGSLVNVAGQVITFNLGTLLNSDSDAGTESIVIDFNVLVTNVATNTLGQALNNAFEVVINGPTVATSNTVGAIVQEPDLTVSKTAVPASGDSGDTITFTVTLSHTGISNADAFDVRVQDILPADFTSLTFNLGTDVNLGGCATGITDASAGNTLDVTIGTIPVTPPGCTVTITYTADLAVTVEPDETYTNTADVFWTSLPGPQGTIGNGTGSDTPGTSGDADGERNGSDGVGLLNDYTVSASDTVTTDTVSINKSIVTTSEVHTVSASPEPLAIGEILRYRLAVELIEGTMNNVVLTDILTNGLALIQDEEVTVTFLSTPAGDVTSLDIPGLNPGTPGNPVALYDNAGVPQVGGVVTVVGQNLTFDLGNLQNTNTNDASAEYAYVEFNVLVLNDAANNLGNAKANTGSVTIDGGPAIPSAPVNAVIVEPNVGITKTAAPITGDGRDTITFTVVVTNPNLPGGNVSTAFDIEVVDTLPAAYTNLVVTGTPAGSIDASAGTMLDVTIPSVLPGATATITYTADLLPSVISGQVIQNTANVTWTSLPGGQGTLGNGTGSDTPGTSGDVDGERNGSGGVNDYTLNDTADVTITGAYTAVKSIETTSEPHTVTASPEPLAIGEILRYQLAVTIPEGTSNTVQLVDRLADGIQLIQDSTVTVEFVADSLLGITGTTNPALDNANGTPLALYGFPAPLDGSLVIVAGTPELVTFNLGTLVNNDNDAGVETVVVRFNVLVLNDAANTIGIAKRNDFDLNVGGATVAVSNIVNVVIVEPTVGLTKIAAPITGDAGDTVSFTLTISNTPTGANDAAIFDLSGSDPLPAGYTNLGNVVTNAGATGAVISAIPAGNTLNYTIDRLDPGESVTITYDADLAIGVTPGQVVLNTATIAGTSLPGPQGTTSNLTGSSTPGTSGQPNGERDGSGGVNDYTVNDNADVTITGTGFAKDLASTSAAHTTGSNVTIGEVVEYILAVTLPEGTTPTLQVIDDLPPGLDYVPGSLTVDTTGAPLAAPFNGTVPAPVITAPGGSGADVTADFTNIIVNADGNPANNIFLVRLQAVVLDVPGNVGAPAGPGQTTLTNNASIQIWANPVVNAAPHTSTVVEPQPVVTKTFTPNTGTINDVVRVTLVIDNTTGTSDLFDITFEDQFDTSLLTTITPVTTPAGFSYAALVDTPAVGITTVQYTGGPVAAGASAVFELDLTLTPGVTAGQVIPNTADVTTSTTLPGPDANERPYTPSGSDTLTVAPPDLTITKSHVGNFTVGVNGTFTLTVSNLPGSGYATGTISVTDAVPANLVVQSASGTGWDCSGTVGQNVSCTRPGPVAPGVTLPVITLVVQPAAPTPPILNTATVPYPADINNANNSDDDTVTILAAPEPDLMITKSHVGDFQVGVNGTFSFRVQNVGSAATTGTITVDDILPAGLTLVSASGSSWNCSTSTIGGQTVQCTTAATVAPGSFTTDITVVVAVDAAATPAVTNTATVTTLGDTNAANDSDNDTVNVNSSVAPDLTLQKTHSGGNMLEGVNADFTITVQNVGSGPTTGAITITDTVPAALVVQGAPSGPNWNCAASAGQNVSCTYTGGPLAAASTLVDFITVTVQPATGSAAGSPYTNTAIVSTPGDTNAGNNSDDDIVTVDASAAPDLTPQKTHSGGNMLEGVNADFIITIQNVGSGPTTGAITVTDTVPAALVVQGAPSGPNWNCAASAGQNVSCTYTGGPLAAASTLVDVITVTVQPAAGSAAGSPYTNTGTVSTPGDTNAGNDSDDDLVTVDASAAPDLTPQKTHSGGNFAVGVNGTFTITVQNIGSGPTTGAITITDTVPAELVVQSVSGPNWDCTASVGQNVSCTYDTATFGQLAAATTLADAISVTVRPSTTSGSPFTNTATVSTPGDTNAANDSDDDIVAVDGALALDLSIQKSHGANFVVGIDGVYTITVTNVSAAPTTGTITVTDTLPIGLGYLTGTGDIGGTAWSCAAVGQVVTCTNTAVLIPGAAADITLTVSVGAGAVGTQINIVNVSTPGDSNPGNNDDVDATTVQLTAEPDLAISKSHIGDFVLNNPAPYSYTLTVRNAGAADATGPIRVTDPVPAAYLTLDSVSGTDWDCAATAGNNVDCTYTGPLPLASGGSLPPITLSVFADVIAGTFDNIATVSAPNDNNPANDVGPDTTVVNSSTVFDPPFGLKIVDATGLPVLQWGMAWLNPNNITAFNVQVTDSIPSNTTYLPGSLSCVANGLSTITTCSYNPGTSTVTWTGSIAPDHGVFDPALAANAVIITFNTLLDPGAAGATNVATAAWDADGDSDISDDVAAGQVPGPAQSPSATYGRPVAAAAAAAASGAFTPEIRKEAFLLPTGLGLPGEPLVWIITVTNSGSGTGTHVVVTDTLPDGLRIDAVRPDRGTYTVSGQTVTFTIGTIGPLEAITLRIETTIISSPADGRFTNLAALTAPAVDTPLTATATIDVVTGLPNTGYPPAEPSH